MEQCHRYVSWQWNFMAMLRQSHTGTAVQPVASAYHSSITALNSDGAHSSCGTCTIVRAFTVSTSWWWQDSAAPSSRHCSEVTMIPSSNCNRVSITRVEWPGCPCLAAVQARPRTNRLHLCGILMTMFCYARLDETLWEFLLVLFS
jgi:hypothetical protein